MAHDSLPVLTAIAVFLLFFSPPPPSGFSGKATSAVEVEVPVLVMALTLEDGSVLYHETSLEDFEKRGELHLPDLGVNQLRTCTAYVRGWGDVCKTEADTCEAAAAGAAACARKRNAQE